MPTAAEFFTLALQHHQAGNLDLAEHLYRQALEADPRHADSYHLLGVLAYQRGDYERSTAAICHALTLRPDYPAAHCNLANTLVAQGKQAEAVVHLRRALALDPTYAEAHYNLGNSLVQLDKVEEAIGCYRQALRINPQLVPAHHALGNALEHLDKIEEAIGCYQIALKLNPHAAETCNSLGNALARQQRIEDALDYFGEALRLKPDFAEAHLNVGNVMQFQGNDDAAVEYYQRALLFRPSFSAAMQRLGDVFLKQGLLARAEVSFRNAFQLETDSPALHSKILLCMSHDPQADPDTVFAEHRRFGQLHQPVPPLPTHPNDPDPERRLRIGYVSSDLYLNGATPRYLEPVLVHHDAQKMEVICYTDIPIPDATTANLQSLVAGWRWTRRLRDAELLELIRSDRIDILVDLAGHCPANRLCVFANKPAPVQATWLGYLNTTGVAAIDYRLTDDVLDPPGQPVRDTEELIRLPSGMCCFAPPQDAPAIAPLPALRHGYLTFGSLNRLYKLNAQVFDLWCQVLHALPDARFLMFRDTLVGTAEHRIRSHFAQRGIGDERLDLRQGSSAPGYLGVYEEIDVALDAFPWSGGVTTCEALWMGVPVLSLCGARPASRNAAAILARVGLSAWVVQTPEDYVALAVRLPKELDRLADLRASMRGRMLATLCDAPGFTRVLEDAYRTMWRRWCAK